MRPMAGDTEMCGHGTEWGCHKRIPEAGPARVLEIEHRPVLFHTECFPPDINTRPCFTRRLMAELSSGR